MKLSEKITITNEDNMIMMARYPDNYFDLAIVDPPYGIGEDGSKNHTRSKIAKAKNYIPFAGKDIEPPNQEYFNELFRVSKNQIIWGANHFFGKVSPCWIVWDKENGENDFADCELAWTSFKTSVRKFKYRWAGMLQEDMKNKEIRIHPTQKPVALYKWLLNKYAKPGDKILDTHLGSGSIAIACHDYGFELTACELDEHYYQSAYKRIRDHMLQATLF
ncbi:DNA methyltransferase [Polluticaenibacter yanchengensis]|uniref:Methyltransferase n=1 Tax=Polluticaenibacter yanchengensis TaxID=3014562 RepID=A0ABT4UKE2_9BACT|nr:DNA methyltransferase [Chitinophagaceae bacterium LY-5]